MLLEHITIEDAKERINIVPKGLNSIEKRLKTIGNKIEILCHDEHGQLVIV